MMTNPKTSAIDPTLRELFNAAPAPAASSAMPDWAHYEKIGGISLFKGTHELQVVAVGNDSPDAILVDTQDCREGQWSRSRWLTILPEEVGGVLQALLQAEVQLADLSASAPAAWPQLPILAGEGTSTSGCVRVLVDRYHERLEVKLSRADAAGKSLRNGQWAKIYPNDIKKAGSLILQAYDRVVASKSEAESDREDASDLPF